LQQYWLFNANNTTFVSAYLSTSAYSDICADTVLTPCQGKKITEEDFHNLKLTESTSGFVTQGLRVSILCCLLHASCWDSWEAQV